MRWIVDTSAWSRLHLAAVERQIERLLTHEDDELVLSPSVELELLRGPQGEAVADERRRLEGAMEVLVADADTFALAADAMEALARRGAVAHRRPIADLITAALAHQHGCGVVHHDGDFDALARDSGLRFEVFRVELDGHRKRGGSAHPARRQRDLRTELAQLVHQMPIDEAERFLTAVVDQARERVSDGPPT